MQVRTNKPFNGRIYALGRSETCNIDVINSDLFRLDLTMSGQDCNTQSVVSSEVWSARRRAWPSTLVYPPKKKKEKEENPDSAGQSGSPRPNLINICQIKINFVSPLNQN